MTLTRRDLLASAALLPLATRAIAGPAKTPPVYAEDGIAIDGTDPVAYFLQGGPVPGDTAFTHVWNGATWRFATQDNRDAFAAQPEAFAPQYGGYCAWAVSEGYTASTVPQAWKTVDGKLYLNYSRRIQRRWERDIPARIRAADENWPGVLV